MVQKDLTGGLERARPVTTGPVEWVCSGHLNLL